MATYVKAVIDQYELGSKLGYFMLDNAESNDTCLETLAKWFPMDVRRRHLRCLRGATAEFYFELWARKGAIGWNSICHMIECALEIRSAIELYQYRGQKPRHDPNHRDLTNDFLNATDWAELERFYHFLKPFYILTKTMEGNANKPGAEGGHGAVWETLKTMN
ncbi:uncharacterized protein LMH87_007535 [Akanthomyces muscarius]|uniref:Uncharacterized protein n=1 Tax=Akanthomyces muscarius TaxID=2231603 RepID=A0A9W8QL91_AKAMU|nr:uncharacterized protein LMH87_007535 [Akanthomyces muscarius]KAJ4159594.1 hypothetical protein LMH87_007535 [Akanthomyces muscarius]